MGTRIKSFVIVFFAFAFLAPVVAQAARGIVSKKPDGGNGRFSGAIIDDKSGEVVIFVDQPLDGGGFFLPIDVNDGVEYEYDAAKGTAYNIRKITEVEVGVQGSLSTDLQSALWNLVIAVNESSAQTTIGIVKNSDVMLSHTGVISKITDKGGKSSGEILDDGGHSVPFINQRIDLGGLPFVAAVYDGVTFDQDTKLHTAINITRPTHAVYTTQGVPVPPDTGPVTDRLLALIRKVTNTVGSTRVVIVTG